MMMSVIIHHRILSKGTHLGDGSYGKPTGKDIYYRVIADCACKNNQVYDEWIVRDQGAMVRQIGFTPKDFAQMLIDKEGGVEKAKQLFNSSSEMKSDYKQGIVPNESAGGNYSKILKNIFKNNYNFSEYARAATIYWPGNKIGHGREDIIKFWNTLKNTFSNIKFSVEHLVIWKNQIKIQSVNKMVLEGNHSEDTLDFGEKSNKNFL